MKVLLRILLLALLLGLMAVLPGVVSRKKQIVPPLMATFQKIQEEQD